MAQYGSKIDKLYANGSGSKLDQLYSDGGGDAASKAATRERKTNDMIDRSLQRAMRSGTPAERIAAARTYQERSSQPGYQQGGGIGSSEANQQRDQKTGEKFTAEGLRLQGKPADVVEGQAAALPQGTKQRLSSGSSGGEWVDVGSSAAPLVTTPPVAQGEAGRGTPAVPDWRTQRAIALDALKGKFTKQDAANALADKAAPQGIDPKYQASKEQMGEELVGSDKLMPIRSEIQKEPASSMASTAFSIDSNIAAMKALAEKIKAPSVKSQEQIQKDETSRQAAEYRKSEIEISDSEQKARKNRISYLDQSIQNLEYGSKDHSYGDMGIGVIGRKARNMDDTKPAAKQAPVDITGKSPDQASIDNKLQQREAAYRAPINDVIERSSFLQRYAV